MQITNLFNSQQPCFFRVASLNLSQVGGRKGKLQVSKHSEFRYPLRFIFFLNSMNSQSWPQEAQEMS